MAESTHTPGPWTWDGVEVLSAHGHIVWELGNRNEADARLIAAAPDLLAALRDTVAALGGIHSENVPESARAAIAKAEGR